MKVGSRAQRILWHVATATEETDVGLVVVLVAELGFNEGAKCSEICARALELGLEPCPAEVGPALRLAYKDQPREGLIIAVEAVIDLVDGSLLVFYVVHDDGLRLSIYYGHPIRFWYSSFRVVFVRRK